MNPNINVGIMGIEGTFGHEALTNYSRDNSLNLNPAYTNNFKDLSNLVKSKEVDYFFVPIINSTSSSGFVSEGLNLVMDEGQVLGEQFLPIHHYLVKKKGAKLSDGNLSERVEELFGKRFMKFLGKIGLTLGMAPVYSHEQAISQCRDNLFSEGLYRYISYGSTALAAKDIAEGRIKGYAICSKFAADLYGLEIVKPQMQDLALNTTRFLFCKRKGIKDSVIFDQRSVTDYRIAITTTMSNSHMHHFINSTVEEAGFRKTHEASTPLRFRKKRDLRVFKSRRYLDFVFGVCEGKVLYKPKGKAISTGIPIQRVLNTISKLKKLEILGVYEMHKFRKGGHPYRQEQNLDGSLHQISEPDLWANVDFKKFLREQKEKHGFKVDLS